mgnify:CR=1 FL=1
MSITAIEHIRQRLRACGAKPCHEQLALRAWTQALPLDSGRRRPEDFLPLQVRTALPSITAELKAIARLRSEHAAEDGSARLLVELADGRTVESVLLARDAGAHLLREVERGCLRVRGHRLHPSQDRSSSWMEVLARVAASTRFTITAQPSEYLPSAEGRLPGTTTEPDGTRP